MSGGRTPVGLLKFMGNEKYRRTIEWHKIQFFWSDERFVSSTDSASNYLMAQENLLSHVPVADDLILRPPTEEITCLDAALKYEQMLIEAFADQQALHSGSIFYPKFDLILLGMGSDGHTASLFPNHRALKDVNLIVPVESKYANPSVPRLSFTLALINSADTVIFMVNGDDKLKLLETFIDSDIQNSSIPASMVAPMNQLVWCVVD